MREIKFRAWTGKRMMEPSRNMVIDSYDGSVNWSFGGNQPEPMDCVLLQYTGLKDKNGKEIYEGDIIRAQFPETQTTTGEARMVVEDICSSYASLRDAILDERDVEVIGNIYENPELLDELTAFINNKDEGEVRAFVCKDDTDYH